MPTYRDDGDIEVTMDALGAIRLIRRAYASSAEAARRVDEVCDLLAIGAPASAPRAQLAIALRAVYGSFRPT